ncbi:MAG: hypothetical protein KAZ45_01935 [Arenimonas sp.]|nr:hypothetical protein [Arenimonas sp.]
MWLLIIVAVIGVAVYFLLRGSSDNPASPKKRNVSSNPDLPSRSMNPALIKNQNSVVAWEFLAPNLSTACVYARNNAGVRRNARDCAALPPPECGSETCACHYRPVYESRKSHRRQDIDRRSSVRFDAGEDRRNSPERRKDVQDWHEKRH